MPRQQDATGRELQLFELELLGGPTERRYRRLRPELEKLPWGTLASEVIPGPDTDRARMAWTQAAFQEHRTAAACTTTLTALVAVRAPLDLIAVASRFPLDEMVHVEMCARVAGELGGGAPLLHEPDALIAPARSDLPLTLQAAELVVRFFCVGEAISIPLLRGAWHAARHPLPKAVLGRIVKDEAAHGQFGWTFLDWILPSLDAGGLRELGHVAGQAIDELQDRWAAMKPGAAAEVHSLNSLGWMETREYLDLARRSLQKQVIEPLAARGIRPV